mgnify:CR=1 FL=1
MGRIKRMLRIIRDLWSHFAHFRFGHDPYSTDYHWRCVQCRASCGCDFKFPQGYI